MNAKVRQRFMSYVRAIKIAQETDDINRHFNSASVYIYALSDTEAVSLFQLHRMMNVSLNVYHKALNQKIESLIDRVMV